MDLAQIMQVLATLAHGLATLTDNINRFVQNPPVNIPAPVLCSKLYIQRPAMYNGKMPADTRRFLATYKA